MPPFVPVWWTNPQPNHAYVLSVVSLIATVVAAIVGISGYVRSESSLMFCYGLENCVDFLSSLVVLWRFYNPGESEERIMELKKREKKASVAISFILFILGIGIVIMAMHDFTEVNTQIEAGISVLIISFFSSIIFFFLTVTKLQMSAVLDSRALLKDGYCSLIGTVLATSLFLNTILVVSNPSLWWLDPTISLICGVVSLFLGLRSILIQTCEKNIPILTPQWWISSQGDVTVKEMETMDKTKQSTEQPQFNNSPIVYEDLDGPGTNNNSIVDLTLTKETEEKTEPSIV